MSMSKSDAIKMAQRLATKFEEPYVVVNIGEGFTAIHHDTAAINGMVAVYTTEEKE